ncbi:MarR family transcriptional regulator [Martelella sp. HB161492]|uniref:MarR family winged helix-turn-helix transcriptional regulator n=1 Tax=Martelella sp. HB161492 TaxID=2720726 RepID=UPI0015917DBC|nr:MarR family transcriptional regulator [Martelella sp. HB161492]
METMTVASRKMRTYYNAQVSRYGLTFARARVILLLSKNEVMNQSALACELELEKPTVVRMLDRMEAIGLISRSPDPNDRRANLISLSEHGKAMAVKLDQVRVEFFDALFGPADTQKLAGGISVFETIIARIEKLEAHDGDI